MKQITRLAKEQKNQVEVYRKRYFDLATSPVTDRQGAEAVIRELLGLVKYEPGSVVWANSPEEAQKIRDSEGNTELLDSLWHSLWYSLQDSLRDSLQYSLRDSLWNSLQDSLRYSLWNSPLDSPLDSLQNSLRYSLLDSLWDSGWICYYTYCRDVLGVKYDPESNRKLDLHNRLLESCFGVWVVPGKIVLLRKPLTVAIGDGKLVGADFIQSLDPKPEASTFTVVDPSLIPATVYVMTGGGAEDPECSVRCRYHKDGRCRLFRTRDEDGKRRPAFLESGSSGIWFRCKACLEATKGGKT